jgi:hypothetical protein
MRWAALFADLEAQLNAAAEAELAGEVADRTRRELARVHLVDRLRMAVGTEVTVGLGAAGTATGTVLRAGPEWCLLGGRAVAETLVVLGAVEWLAGLPAAATEPAAEGVVASRLGLAYLLRTLARDRSALTVILRDGRGLTGTIDSVGADFVDLSEHPADEPRRRPLVRGARTVSLSAVAMVRPV